MRYFYLGFCLLYQILSATEAPLATPPSSKAPASSLQSQPAPTTTPLSSSKEQNVTPSDQNSSNSDQKIHPSSDQNTTAQEPALHVMDYRTLVWKIFIFMGVFIVLCFVTLQFFKKLSKTKLFASNNLHHIKILERRPLSSKTVLYLIDLAGKQILVAESQLEVRSLAQIDWNMPTYEKDKSL